MDFKSSTQQEHNSFPETTVSTELKLQQSHSQMWGGLAAVSAFLTALIVLAVIVTQGFIFFGGAIVFIPTILFPTLLLISLWMLYKSLSLKPWKKRKVLPIFILVLFGYIYFPGTLILELILPPPLLLRIQCHFRDCETARVVFIEPTPSAQVNSLPSTQAIPVEQGARQSEKNAPRVYLNVSNQSTAGGVPFTLSLEGQSDVAFSNMWWWVKNVTPGVNEGVIMGKIDGIVKNLASAQDLSTCSNVETSCNYSREIVIDTPGTYRFEANARDSLYPEKHRQTSEGYGTPSVEVVIY